jgi:hypothetical protein
MRPLATITALLLMSMCAHAQAAKSCEDLKAEIAKKIEANNVKSYSLDIVAKDDNTTEGKVVGTCEGGTKKILYRRTSAPPQTPAPKESKP